MHPSSMHYFPLAWPFLALLFILAVVAFAVIEFRILQYAYSRLGISSRYVLAILLCSLLGSYVNIPVAQLPPEHVETDQLVDSFGVTYVVPTVQEWPRTIIAVNVGGALIPAVLSLYLLVRFRLYFQSLAAVAVVAAVVHSMARPVHGLGITIPTFIPPILAGFVAMLLAWRRAPALAYIAGSMGTLIGADLLNLDKIQGLGAPIASIGGAGTFDGVFLTGIIAVLLPPIERAIVPRRESAPQEGAPAPPRSLEPPRFPPDFPRT